MNRYTTRPDLLKMMQKYEEGTATAAETAFIDRYYAFFDQHHKQDLPLDPATQESMQQEMETWLANYINQPKPVSKRSKLWPRIGIAAAVAGIAMGTWFYTNELAWLRKAPGNDQWVKNDIAPGGNHATLTSNGNTINLSEAKTGIDVKASTLSYNDGTVISSAARDLLNSTDKRSLPNSRDDARGRDDASVLTLATPKGGTYSIILQDGTKVWLNADSKLEFFSNYRNKLQRIVKLTGEGYFEVARVFSPARNGKGPQRLPFIVESNGQVVEVLGTHFNISAYKGEPIRTTLLEGSVAVTSTTPLPKTSDTRAITYSGTVLKPNQQAVVTGNEKITVGEADPNATAWKSGKFRFNNTSLEEVMKQLARWYDVEVIYPNGIPDERFTGGINRNSKASEALRILQIMKVKFKIEGKQIIVSK
ncbi:FecR family protein [Pedobacter africanus]|uniref:FecR family protein n=1 Tax=Pedobacter africanus TaxID=151894 RepID=A0A1W2BPT7_9SPHI|nr:FecR family protein [Pedobacter africanus]SMC74652.1 FecR family protein [Pedobacter africanus]